MEALCAEFLVVPLVGAGVRGHQFRRFEGQRYRWRGRGKKNYCSENNWRL